MSRATTRVQSRCATAARSCSGDGGVASTVSIAAARAPGSSGGTVQRGWQVVEGAAWAAVVIQVVSVVVSVDTGQRRSLSFWN